MAKRTAGEVWGLPRRVGPRQVAYDLKYMIAVLGWGMSAKDEFGKPYLDQQPWSAERRKAVGMRMPAEGKPRRPLMTDEIRAGLTRHSPTQQFTRALILGRDAVSRNSSVRHLMWSDVDLDNASARWRSEYDKNRQQIRVPLPPEAVEALRSGQRKVGDVWVFPAASDPAAPTPRNTFHGWQRRARVRFLASIENPAQQRRLAAQMEGLGITGKSTRACGTPGSGAWSQRSRRRSPGPITRRCGKSTTISDWRRSPRPCSARDCSAFQRTNWQQRVGSKPKGEERRKPRHCVSSIRTLVYRSGPG